MEYDWKKNESVTPGLWRVTTHFLGVYSVASPRPRNFGGFKQLFWGVFSNSSGFLRYNPISYTRSWKPFYLAQKTKNVGNPFRTPQCSSLRSCHHNSKRTTYGVHRIDYPNNKLKFIGYQYIYDNNKQKPGTYFGKLSLV